MPTSRGIKSSFGGLPPIPVLSSWAYPAARPETTALWYSALTSILPSVAGVVMVLFHIVGVGASLHLGRFILDFGCGACRYRRGTGTQAHVSAGKARKDIRKWTPPLDKPLWSMGSSYGYVLAVRLCILAASLPLEEQICGSCQLRWLVDVMIPWLPEAVRAVVFAGRWC